MTKIKVTYFDFSGSRGEDVRLALALTGQPFEDIRLGRDAFAALKPDLPFGALPVVEIDGHGMFSQSNAILRLIGRLHGLYPDDPFDAARHDALMDACEDLRHRMSPTMRIKDPIEKTAARKLLVQGYLAQWARTVDGLIGDGPFVGGAEPGVADVKLFVIDRWISDAILDDIPADLFDGCPKLKRLSSAFRALPAVTAWYQT